MAEWIERGEVLARLRLICLPKTARISLQEATGGGAALSAQGLPHGLRLALQVGRTEEAVVVSSDVARIAFPAPSVPPGELSLRLSDVDVGAALRLIAPWPARSGLILDPSGKRLDRYRPIATMACAAGGRSFRRVSTATWCCILRTIEEWRFPSLARCHSTPSCR